MSSQCSNTPSSVSNSRALATRLSLRLISSRDPRTNFLSSTVSTGEVRGFWLPLLLLAFWGKCAEGWRAAALRASWASSAEVTFAETASEMARISPAGRAGVRAGVVGVFACAGAEAYKG
eukprot:5131391-Amphidinium_carterae.2